jgi:probable rRNA maturation factor
VTPRVEIALAGRRLPSTVVRHIARRVRRAAGRLGIGRERLSSLTIRIVDDRQMSALHQRHMSLAGPTDVLSFPPADLPGPRGTAAVDLAPLGDIVIDWDAVIRQASRGGWTGWTDEAVSLAIHGLVHLLGHDHRTRTEARPMLRIERRASRAAGLPAVVRPYGGIW